MPLTSFLDERKKKSLLSLSDSGNESSLGNFLKNKGIETIPFSGVKTQIGQETFKGDSPRVPRNVDEARKLQEEDPSLWEKISKQLMKPVGLVATAVEDIGNTITDVSEGKGVGRLLKTPARLGGVITGDRETSFSDLYARYGVKAGLSPGLSAALGFGTDIISDPFNFVGGGLTKAGQVASKLQKLKQAGRTVEKGSKLHKEMEALGLTEDLAKLAPTKAEQAMQGQRAFIKILGGTRFETTLFKGVSLFEKSSKLGGAIKQTRFADYILRVFSTRTSNEAFNVARDHADNMITYRKGKVMEEALDIQNKVGVMGKSDALRVVDVIETGKNTGIKTIDDLAGQIKKNFALIKAEEKKLGLLKSELQLYFPHIKIRDKESIAQKIKNLFSSPKKYGTALGSSKVRKIEGTVSEINEQFGTNFFQNSPAIAYAERALASSRAVESKKFFNSVKQFAVKDGVEVGIADLKGLRFDPDVARQLTQYSQSVQPQEIKAALRIIDRVQNLWKAQALVAPSYHIRNNVGNVWNNFLAGVKNPRSYMRALRMQVGKTIEFVDVTGKKWTNKSIIDEAKRTGVLNEGWFARDIEIGLSSEIGGSSWNPLKQNFGLFKANRQVGQAIENNARLAHFIEKIEGGMPPADAAASVKKFLFDYGDLTWTEKNVLKRVIPFYCVPDDGEILTKKGWKTLYELQEGIDEVLVYDHYKDSAKWDILNKVASFDYEGELMSISDSRNGKFLFTPNHGWPVIDHNNMRFMSKGYELRSNYRIPLIPSEVDWPEDSELTDQEAEILGWVLSDGHIDKNRKRVVIYQSKEQFVKRLNDLLKDCSSKYIAKINGNNNDMSIWTLNGEMKSKILAIIPNKHKNVFNILPLLNKKTAKILWNSMYDGDGTTSKRDDGKRHCKFFAQQPGLIFDFFQILTIMLGNVAQQATTKRGCYIREENKTIKLAGKIGSEWYKGKVWCPELKGKCWLLRRNGKVILSQNTWTRKNIPLQFEQLLKQPEKLAALAKTQNAIEQQISKPNEKYLSDYIKENIGVRVGEDKDGNTFYFLMGNWLPAAQAVDFLSQPSENMIAMVSPFLKTPIELWANQSSFFEDTLGQDAPIERYPEENVSWLGFTMRKKTNYILKNIRILNELDKLNPGSIFGDKDSPSLVNQIAPELGFRLPGGIGTITTSEKRGGRYTPDTTQGGRVLQSLFGKLVPYNPRFAKRFYIWDTETKVRELNSAIRDARRDGQREYADRLRKELRKFQKERR